MQVLQKGEHTTTTEGVAYGDFNVAVNVESGGGTLAIQSLIGSTWTTFKTITGANEFPKVEVANAAPIRLLVTGVVAYHVY